MTTLGRTMENKWALAFFVLLGATIISAIIVLSRISELQTDLSNARDDASQSVDEADDLADDLAEDLEDAEDEIEQLRKRLRNLREKESVVSANDFGLPGLVLELDQEWICYQWPRCWDIEVPATVVNNTDQGGVVECLVAMEYENGDVIRESVWSDYVPGHEQTPVTFFHYQDNFGPDIESVYSEGCRWGDGPRDI